MRGYRLEAAHCECEERGDVRNIGESWVVHQAPQYLRLFAQQKLATAPTDNIVSSQDGLEYVLES